LPYAWTMFGSSETFFLCCFLVNGPFSRSDLLTIAGGPQNLFSGQESSAKLLPKLLECPVSARKGNDSSSRNATVEKGIGGGKEGKGRRKRSHPPFTCYFQPRMGAGKTELEVGEFKQVRAFLARKMSKKEEKRQQPEVEMRHCRGTHRHRQVNQSQF
jgi:hypothetical protein